MIYPAMNGLKKQEEKQNKIKTLVCPKCSKVNQSINLYCSCGEPLNEEEARRKNADNMLNKLFADDEVRALLTKKMAELK